MAFLSGDPDRAEELSQLVKTLERARDRINAVATDATEERNAIIRKQKQHICEVWEKTRKKLHWNSDSVGGGAAVVMEMMEPTMAALDKASWEYKKALAEGAETT